MASEMLVLENFIGGKFVPCANYIDGYNPSTGKVYCKVPDSGKEEVDMAVKAASEAFERLSLCSGAAICCTSAPSILRIYELFH